VRRIHFGIIFLVAGAFLVGFLTHLLYQRWTLSPQEGQFHPVTFSPAPPPAPPVATTPIVQAIEVEKIRQLAGTQAKVRGRVYRVGRSAKSNTYFLNFGPSRSSFTAVIFESSLGLFEKMKFRPESYEGKELELTGKIKDHPEYGLEMIIEEPGQIKVLN
jgi:hypothetical protein